MCSRISPHFLFYYIQSILFYVKFFDPLDLSFVKGDKNGSICILLYIYTMEYYLLSYKNNDFMKCAGKWLELENIILSEVTQTQNNKRGMYSLISGY
jgi:hypothetical protein